MGGEAGAAWVIAPGRVDEQDVGRRRERPRGGLEARPFAQGEQPRGVAGARLAGDGGVLDHVSATKHGCPRPGPVPLRPDTGLSSREADDNGADQGFALLLRSP